MSAKARAAPDPVAQFFADLSERGHIPKWVDLTGRVRIEIVDGARSDVWLVAIDKGNVTVSHADGDFECSIRADKALVEKLVRGETNAMAATLRGEAVPDGNLELLLGFQRIFPGPIEQQRPAPIGRSSRWTPT